MEKNGRICISYIATGKYSRFTSQFLQNIGKAFKDKYLKVVILSDMDDSEWSDICECNRSDLEENKIEVRLLNQVNYPWPILTLYKFRWMLKAFEFAQKEWGDIDWLVNLDATVIPNRVIESDEFLFKDKLAVVQHFLWNQVNFDEKADCFWTNYDGSVAWRDSRKIKWQAFPGFVSIPANLVSFVCTEIGKMLTEDSKNNVIPYFHDESYYNKFLDQHQNLVHLIEDQVWEDDDPKYCQYNSQAMWRVLSYQGLQNDKIAK